MNLPAQVQFRYSAIDTAVSAAESSCAWLGEKERSELARLHDAGRRRQWLAGRWLAKQLLCEAGCAGNLTEVEIVSRDAQGRGVRPRVLIRAGELSRSLSIAHTDRGALVVLAATSRLLVGADLAPCVIPADDGFCRLWFSSLERQWIDHDPAKRLALMWALKEAIYKAVNAGESWNPRQIEIRPRGLENFDCSYRGRPLGGLAIEFQPCDGQLAAVVSLARVGLERKAATPSHARSAIVSGRQRFSASRTARFVAGSY
jgi:phosphopantetheinyl transferase